MLILPNTLPQEIRAAIEPQLQHDSLEPFLKGTAQAALSLFGAVDVFLLAHIRTDAGEAGAPPGQLAAGGHLRRIAYLSGKGGPRTEAACDLFTRRWLETGIHSYLTKDLHSRLAAISYSAFSWPYPRLAVSSLGTEVGFAVPREYTLLLPFTADLTVREQDEPIFFGYLMLLFDEFPTLADPVVQLIISLPQLLSDVTSAYLRREAARLH